MDRDGIGNVQVDRGQSREFGPGWRGGGEGAAELATGAGDIDTHDLIMADASSSALRSPDIPSCISRVF